MSTKLTTSAAPANTLSADTVVAIEASEKASFVTVSHGTRFSGSSCPFRKVATSAVPGRLGGRTWVSTLLELEIPERVPGIPPVEPYSTDGVLKVTTVRGAHGKRRR